LDVIKKITDKKFYKLSFLEKEEKLNQFLLKNYKIGDSILCFEDRIRHSPDFYRFNTTPKKLKSFSVGKVYKILDLKNETQIKIKSDTNKKIWTTSKRFLGITALRREKLKNIEKYTKK